jgi:hypothetical protein
MKPYEEQEALDHLHKLHARIGRVSEADLLEMLARDDQPNNTKDPDPIHRAVAELCKALRIANEAWQHAGNIMTYLKESQPSGRQSTITDCIACKQPALGRIRSGLCSDCHKEWRAFMADNPGKSHHDFIVWQAKMASQAGQIDGS